MREGCSRRVAGVAVAIASLLVIGLSATVAGAGEQLPSLTGEQTCDDGDANITWTLTNFLDGSFDIESSSMSIDDGPDLDLTFSPNPLPALGTSTAEIVVEDVTETATATAAAVILGQGPIEIEGELEIEPCEQPLEPTSTTVTATSGAESTDVRPTFTG